MYHAGVHKLGYCELSEEAWSLGLRITHKDVPSKVDEAMTEAGTRKVTRSDGEDILICFDITSKNTVARGATKAP